MTSSQTVVVHGATGAQGAPVVRHLLAAGHRVRAAVRDPRAPLPPGAEGVAADLNDTASLAAAYAEADAVVVQLPLVFAADTAVAQAESVLAALRKAGVAQAVFNTGGVLADEGVGVPFVDARALMTARLAECVATASVVAPARTYLENLAAPWSAARVRAGEVAYPLPSDLPVPWVALDDLGATVAELATAPEPPPLQIVAGPQSLTGDQVAAGLSAALGQEVRWKTIAPAEYEQMLTPYLGQEAAAGVAAAYLPPPPGAPLPPAADPAAVRTGPTTLRDWATRQHWPQ
ncbi:NmrA family NAD(P)-binding protein [Streptomyces sp. NPDC049597]|uniref:NmrA family NAD(P)-binding protein n=1 Tax=Streptomyces sp. NPDC049597 TaxID=3155276 RepID=UPI0034437C65